MSRDGAALLGGLLLGGLAVGAAMSANNAAQRQDRRNHARYPRQQQRHVQKATYCICGAQMIQGRVQQGIPKCNNLNCQRILSNQILWYCPNGGNVQQHRKGFFYCQQCASSLRRGAAVKQLAPKPVPQPQPQKIIYQQQPSGQQYPAQVIAPKTKQYKGPFVVKQGYMSKKGDSWFGNTFKKRWFKLYSNQKMAYLETPKSTHTKGYCDFTKIKKMDKKSNNGFEVITPQRTWVFLCNSVIERDEWFITIKNLCTDIKPKVYVQQPAKPQYVQPQPQVPIAPPYVPQPQQPIYRGSAIQQPSQPSASQSQSQSQPQRPQSQSLQPGMVGYNGGNMYGSYPEQKTAPSAPSSSSTTTSKNYNSGNMYGSYPDHPTAPSASTNPSQPAMNNNNNQKWEVSAPPAAFADPSAPSAPPEEDELNQNEGGGFTGQ